MDFVTAEEKFQELQARIRRGEPLSEDQYQEELAKLMVQDESGVFLVARTRHGALVVFQRHGMDARHAAAPNRAASRRAAAPTHRGNASGISTARRASSAH